MNAEGPADVGQRESSELQEGAIATPHASRKSTVTEEEHFAKTVASHWDVSDLTGLPEPNAVDAERQNLREAANVAKSLGGERAKGGA